MNETPNQNRDADTNNLESEKKLKFDRLNKIIDNLASYFRKNYDNQNDPSDSWEDYELTDTLCVGITSSGELMFDNLNDLNSSFSIETTDDKNIKLFVDGKSHNLDSSLDIESKLIEMLKVNYGIQLNEKGEVFIGDQVHFDKVDVSEEYAENINERIVLSNSILSNINNIINHPETLKAVNSSIKITEINPEKQWNAGKIRCLLFCYDSEIDKSIVIARTPNGYLEIFEGNYERGMPGSRSEGRVDLKNTLLSGDSENTYLKDLVTRISSEGFSSF